MSKNQIVSPFIGSNHKHAYCQKLAMLKAEASCDQRRLRLTAIRRRVLELVWENHGPVKAYDILEVLKTEKKGAAPPTVYRALDFLLQEGFVHKVESLNAYIGCGEPGHDNSAQLLICYECGVVAEMDDGDIQDLIMLRASRLGFTSRHQTIEVQGLCRECNPV
jgi:Fur family zinc uptake transcriptional regulator